MNKTKIAMLLVVAGVAVQASAQLKVGVLNLNLTHRHQALGTTSATNSASRYGVINERTQRFDTNSFDTLADPDCRGNISYKTELLPNVTAVSLINALNAGLQGANRNAGFYPLKQNGYDLAGNTVFTRGSFTPTAKIMLVDYDNRLLAPPYVGARPGSAGYHRPFFNAPWYYDVDATLPQNNNGYPNIPVAGDLANSEVPVNIFSWPNLTPLAWGRTPYDSQYLPKAVARVIVWDTNNVNPNLRCFDVTPFFTFEEASCQFCYDTDGRVTDGNIRTTQNQDNVLPCCDDPPLICSYIGSGVTKFYLTVKFNNSQNNPLPAVYYNSSLYRQDEGGIFGKKLSWTDLGYPTVKGGNWDFGSYLSENNAILANNTSQSKDSLIFAVGGIVEYPWSYVNSVSKGTMTMQYAEGFGQNPFCGVFRGQVSITELVNFPLSCYNAANWVIQNFEVTGGNL